LTPGIIPSKRGELAEKMGEMVGSHLLTSEDVGRALEKDTFRRELREAMGGKLGKLLDRQLGSLESLVPSELRPRFRDVVDLLRWKIVRTVFDYVEGEPFEKSLRDYLRRKESELLARDLESFLTPRRYDALRAHLDERLTAFFRSEGVEQAVAGYVDAATERWLSSEKPIRQVIPDDLLGIVMNQLEKEIPPLLERFGGMLYDPDFRARLVEKGKKGIEGFLDSLGGLTGLLAGFINLEKVYGRIPEFLDQAGDEIARWLREEKTQQRIAQMFRERVGALLDIPLNAYIEKVPYEKVAGVRRFLRNRAVDILKGRKTADAALALAESGVERIKDRSFETLLKGAFPEGGLDRARDILADRILEALRSSAARDAFEKVLSAKMEELLFQTSLGKLSSRIPGDVREELEEGIYRQLCDLLKKEVPPLVETLNIRRLVEEKVNSLDILKVEDLLMGIMKEQFKYINLFGALLGFLIGLINVVALRLL